MLTCKTCGRGAWAGAQDYCVGKRHCIVRDESYVKRLRDIVDRAERKRETS